MPETDARPIVMAALELAALAGAGLLGWAVAEDAAGAAVPAEPEPLEQAVAARAIPAAQAAAAIQFFMRMLPRENARPGAPHLVRPPVAFWSLPGSTCAARRRFSAGAGDAG